MPLDQVDQTASNNLLPKSRDNEIVIQEVENEVLVYDLKTDKAHHLNKTMTEVWKNCDGKTSVRQLSEKLSKKLNEKIEGDFIWLALDELEKANLLEEKVDSKIFSKFSRRKVLFKYASIAVALPAVMSLITSTAAQAGSCLGNNANCTQNAQCCSGNCESEGFCN